MWSERWRAMLTRSGARAAAGRPTSDQSEPDRAACEPPAPLPGAPAVGATAAAPDPTAPPRLHPPTLVGSARLPVGRRLRRAGSAAARLLLGWLALSVIGVGALRFIDPPTSAFQLRHALSAWRDPQVPAPRHGPWVPLESMGPWVPLAVIAAEDQRFPTHSGFDLIEIRRALDRHRAGGRLRGASTISQQTARNLFLWPGRDWLRKGLEAWFTVLIEALWPKRRILEVYLNLAQFGPDTYGVGAASRRYFARPPGALARSEAARLAAVLPNPHDFRLDTPGPRQLRRAGWIERQMRALGPATLHDL